MKIRLFSLLLAFALLINFSGVHVLALELSTAMAHTGSTPPHGGAGKSDAHYGCAMHAHVDATSNNHVCDESAKKSHVCGSLKCNCGCHLSALTFAAISLAGAAHAAKLNVFQPQRVPLPPVKLNLRPPISA